MALHTLEICSGVGMLGEGLRAGFQYLGIKTRTVCHIEREAYAASVLAARIEEGSMDAAPVWSDLCTFDAGAWRGAVDCIVAGFPCQDISLAGRRAGLDGARSGLFFKILNIADACGAQSLFLENVAGIASATSTAVDEAAASDITGQSYRPAGSGSAGVDCRIHEEDGAVLERAAARVVGELADRGWDAEWITLSASDVGASHGRARWFCWAWRRLGNTGLQHQHLQQRQDGAEYQGAGQPVAYPERAERRPERAGSTGAIQGHDGGRREADGGAGIADAVLGNSNDERAHRCGCGAEQDGRCEFENTGGCMANTTGHGRHQRRAEPSGEQGRPDAAECGCAVANTSSTGQQGCELGRTCTGNWGGAQAHGSASQLCGLFAPGPSDPRWAGIIAGQPWLAPAIDKETESLLRGTPDGLARKLDFDNRASRLRCVGNGVVALCASTALVLLLRRAGFMKQKQPAAQSNRAQAAINTVAEATA